MCPESLVEFVEGKEAQVGDQAMIQQFQRGTHQFMMFARTSAPDCPICLPDNSTIRFTNVPAVIQKRAGVGAEAVAVLENGMAYTSMFRFENGAAAMLNELRGCEFQVIDPDMEETDDIDREASEVMAEVGRTIEAETEVEPVLIGASGRSVARGVGAALLLFFVVLLIG